MKIIRTVGQIMLLTFLFIYAAVSIIQRQTGHDSSSSAAVPPLTNSTSGNESSFIAISYPGLTKSTSLESKIVNDKVFAEQIEALKASGYVAISQSDIINYFLYFGRLPEKALFLIFEDGISDTTMLAQDVLVDNNYLATICTYANNLEDVNNKFVTIADLKKLLNSGCWEMGSNGYRLSYINVYDRYGNYSGHLNGDEFAKIYSYLGHDYNHYLMDFKRDEDRLRGESEDELMQRIQKDYELMRSTYQTALNIVPNMYILMHSNTGAFGTDPISSTANRNGLTDLFAMNFNRQGTCLNTLDSSIYDLSRLQVQSYFSVNHLLMRVKDDTGDEVAFVIGDDKEAKNWYLDNGVAQYKGDEIILTTNPRGEGQITLKSLLVSDLDMTVTLQGNIVGCQSISLCTDRDVKRGIQVALENNELVVRDLEQDGQELFRCNLFEFDGGPYISTQEDEYNGLVALQKAIIQYDESPERVAEATAKLTELENTPVLTLEDGGTPYYPELDVTERGNRKLRIRLVDSYLSIWIDGKTVVEMLPVSAAKLGSITLGAKVYANEDDYNQPYINDDVYDAVFINLVVNDPQNSDGTLYSYSMTHRQNINARITGWFNTIVDFFVDNF